MAKKSVQTQPLAVSAKRPMADSAAPFTKYIAYAIKALSVGQASEAQQIAALNWIVTYASGIDSNAYSRLSERDTWFALGKHFVAGQVNAVIKLDPA
jgi:hypothetical protein